MEKINFDIIDIKNEANNAITYTRGVEYYNSGLVQDLYTSKYSPPNKEITITYNAKVTGSFSLIYDVNIITNESGDILKYNCSCPAFSEHNKACKHVTALLLKLYYKYNIMSKNTKNNEQKRQEVVPIRNYPLEDLIKVFENKITASIRDTHIDGAIKLTPILNIQDSQTLSLEFTIGDKKQYVVKDAYTLAANIKSAGYARYGKTLEFTHSLNNFDLYSQPIAKFLMEEADDYRKILIQTQGYYSSFTLAGRAFKIYPFSLDSFFDLFEGKSIDCFGYKYRYDNITFVNHDPEVNFYIKQKEKSYYFSSDLSIANTFTSKKYTYLIIKDCYYRCTTDFVNNVLPACEKIMSQPTRSMLLSDNYMGKFCSCVLPQISKCSNIKSDLDLSEKFKPTELKTVVYLDTNDSGNIYTDVIFNYGDLKIDALKKSDDDNSLVRDIIGEWKIITFIESCNFIRTTTQYSMMDEYYIYEFLTVKIYELMKLCEVNASEAFKKINIKFPKSMLMGIRLKSNLIEIDIKSLEFDPAELKDILNMYKRKKKYFRLKDGSFISLDNDYFGTMEKIVDDLDISDEDLISGKISIPKYKSLYLDSLIKDNEWVSANKSIEFKNMVMNIMEAEQTDYELPDSLKNIMRNYQKTGYKWLKTLAQYYLGGILADDMGLGKTLQIISMLLSEKGTCTKPSLVVCPTSLLYNWKSEIEKFSPDIISLIVSGNADMRSDLIETIGKYDLIITSYDLLKRDIDMYESISFRYSILDEAQYIKNANTQNAKAVKLINSEIKFALTGTPIENSLADLWSIFDYIMPGFLSTYKKFKDRYETPIIKEESQDMLKRLHNQIQPFILRRLKKDVLKELPDKIETVSYAQMESIQRKAYEAELLKFNSEFNDEVSKNGYDKSQIKILAMLMKLRQICCHPSLFYENYNGGSAKLDQCMQLVKGSIETNHKVIIFSQFTSMLRLIEKELIHEDIGYYSLTGATKSNERLKLANEFNINDVPVFLISLKAGGTGLNLIGADIVIHFDPWWNISAQNQATDRTHRIGQKNKVQVFKLIAKDTIEEKIEILQRRKQDLAESVIKEGEVIINSLSRDEINSLFEI